ncbi:MAG: MoaD/ThiS family protein [Anaerolineae bacterium]|nr:MoaD/ThiS family protein [Anaerolineae bacterium]
MKVKVYLHTILQRETPEGMQRELDVTVLSGSSVADLTTDLGVDLPVDEMMLVVNGRLAPPSYPLQEGDQVHFMPAVNTNPSRPPDRASLHQ